MINTLVFIFYTGGWIPAYKYARNNGIGRIFSLIDALAWPYDVGYELAQKYCAKHKPYD